MSKNISSELFELSNDLSNTFSKRKVLKDKYMDTCRQMISELNSKFDKFSFIIYNDVRISEPAEEPFQKLFIKVQYKKNTSQHLNLLITNRFISIYEANHTFELQTILEIRTVIQKYLDVV